jgi:RNA-directed DNA polymerase
MHDPEKSDSGIVATKPTNKDVRSVAEPVEPRPGTKGNADQQSTHRAQSRARVTQALGRVRQATRQRKKEKFTALLHHISPAHPEAAQCRSSGDRERAYPSKLFMGV